MDSSPKKRHIQEVSSRESEVQPIGKDKVCFVYPNGEVVINTPNFTPDPVSNAATYPQPGTASFSY